MKRKDVGEDHDNDISKKDYEMCEMQDLQRNETKAKKAWRTAANLTPD